MLNSKPTHLVITCEHGGNQVPPKFASVFKNRKKELNSHRGYDPGALELAKELSETLGSPFFFSSTTRLLVDLNRSVRNRSLFSEFTSSLDAKTKKKILEYYYYPYRNDVENYIQQAIRGKQQVLHLSVHSFTPILSVQERRVDIGFLYDPRRRKEKEFCRLWRLAMQKKAPCPLLFRNNQPYRGRSDGLTTYLRSKHKENDYLGIELEVNQKYPLCHITLWNDLKRMIIDSLKIQQI